jgi:multiple sugar transport system substrate-binding protein
VRGECRAKGEGEMRDKRWRRWLFLFVSVVMIAAACGGGDEAPTETPTAPGESPAGEFDLATAAEPFGGVEIRVLDEITDLQPTFAEQVVPRFEEITGIRVNYELQGHFDVIQVGEADLFSGTGTYDLVMMHQWQINDGIDAQAIEFLDSYLEDPALRDPSVDPANFIQPVTDEATVVDGHRICFPNWNYQQIWVGRRDLMENPDEQAAFMENYGYELAPPTTLQEMRDIAEFFTRPAGATLAGETLENPSYGFIQEGARLGVTWSDVWFNYLRQFGGDLFDEQGTPTANRPENVAGLEFWKSMFEFAPPGAAELSLLDIPVTLGEGQAVSGIAWSDFFWSVDKEGGSPHAGNFTYAPVPPNGDSPDLHQVNTVPSCLVINPASENKEAAFLFLQWLATQETQDTWLETALEAGGGFDPVLQSSFDNPAYTSGPRAELLAAIQGSMESGIAIPFISELRKHFDVMLQRFQEFLLGQSTAQEALDALQQDMEGICPSNCALQVP